MDAKAELSSLHRGLQALEILAVQGATTISALGRALGLPRANVYRIIRTLEATGYCLLIPDSSQYIATAKLGFIAGKLSDSDRLINAALPAFASARDRIEWPIGLVVPQGLDMLVCLSTDKQNSFAISKFLPGRTTPMLKTTSGILTLAFAQDDAREAQIARLIEAGQLDQFFFGDLTTLHRVLRKAQANGYVLNDSRYTEGSVSVPIIVDGRLIGCMMTKYIRAAINRERVLRDCLPVLQDSVAAIATALGQQPAPR